MRTPMRRPADDGTPVPRIPAGAPLVPRAPALHHAEVFRLAGRVRRPTRPDLGAERMSLLLRLHGID